MAKDQNTLAPYVVESHLNASAVAVAVALTAARPRVGDVCLAAVAAHSTKPRLPQVRYSCLGLLLRSIGHETVARPSGSTNIGQVFLKFRQCNGAVQI